MGINQKSFRFRGKNVKRILIDLDVLTNAFWKGGKSEVAKRFLDDISKGDMEILTPSTLLYLIFNWKNRRLAGSILSFYSDNSDILSQKTILKEFDKLGIDYKKIIEELTKVAGKEEDVFLVLVASVFNLCIVTFNKKHLISKNEGINKILHQFNLQEVEINEPI